MSDTPETENLARGNHVVPTEWAEKLERERNEARAELARITVIEAVRYDGTAKSRSEILDFMGLDSVTFSDTQGLFISTLEGEMTVSIGDWIIKGIKGEIYPCKPDIFEATYEPVKEGAK